MAEVFDFPPEDPIDELMVRLALIGPEKILTPDKIDSTGMDDLGIIESQKIRRIYSLAPLIEIEIDMLDKAANQEEDDDLSEAMLDRVMQLNELLSLARHYFWSAAARVIPDLLEYQYPRVTDDWHIVAMPEDPFSIDLDEASELVYADSEPTRYYH